MPPPRALRPAGVPDDRHAAGTSAFRLAEAEVAGGIAAAGAARPEVTFDDEPPPRRLAPQALAIAASVEVGDHELGVGRFVLLYDPAGQEGWVGPFRVIAYLRAELEPEIAADDFIGQVGWSWLTEALELGQAGYAAPSGTVTRVVTEGFGTKADQPVATEFEMRASWSPVAGDRDSYGLDRHVVAWVETLCLACGMPPLPPGVAPLPARPSQRGVPGGRPPGPSQSPQPGQREVQGGRPPGPTQSPQPGQRGVPGGRPPGPTQRRGR